MNSAELKRAKRDVRRRVLAERDSVPAPDRARLGAVVAERFLRLPEMDVASTVMSFWAFGSELPTAPLIEALHARGVRVALPCVVEGELEPRIYRPGDAVTATSFGALEPTGGAAVEPTDIDLVAVPAVAFDRQCRRVGYGGGFYDRFLLRVRSSAPRIGIGYGVQLLPPEQTLPAGRFDRRVDVVLTESDIVRCSP